MKIWKKDSNSQEPENPVLAEVLVTLFRTKIGSSRLSLMHSHIRLLLVLAVALAAWTKALQILKGMIVHKHLFPN